MSSHNPFIPRLKQLDRASPEFPDELLVILGETIQDHASNIPPQDAIWLVNYLDDVRNSPPNVWAPDP